MTTKDRFVEFIHQLQDEICAAVENCDGRAAFVEDQWDRPGGGGGKTRVIRDGAVFEKGGVNTSVVHGALPQVMQERFGVEESEFFACGISLVIHPVSPMVPTVHANFRFFELTGKDGKVADAWFGGGADLTPYYLFDEDAVHFHKTFKAPCDKHDKSLYPKYKKECDDYFFNTHRGERRGIGGLFFDYLRDSEVRSLEEWGEFVRDTGSAFVDSYIPIVERRKSAEWTEEQKTWQEIRRGRYVEFNLIHDRGTLFGLKTNGRIESILMSLPAIARWEYDHHPAEGSEEARLVEVLRVPKEWI